MATEKIKKFAKNAGARMRGHSGILSTLTGEHAEVSSLMHEVLSASPYTEAAAERYPTIRKKLLAHARAEQQVLYTRCQEYPETAALVGHSLEEHRAMERLLGELDRTPVEAPSWLERLGELQELVEDHVRDEEDELFPRCADLFSHDVLSELDDDYQALRDTAAKQVEGMHVRESPRPAL